MASVCGFRVEAATKAGCFSFSRVCWRLLRGSRPKRERREAEGGEAEATEAAEAAEAAGRGLAATTSKTTRPGSSLAALTLPEETSLKN